MPESIKIPVKGKSAGVVEIVISDSPSVGKVHATVTYLPKPGEEEPREMLFGYRDETGGHMIGMNKSEDGHWIAEIEISPNASPDFFLHPNVKPGELRERPNIINKISLMDGRIVRSTYENMELSEDKKGRLEKRVYSMDGSLSEPVDDTYLPKFGEKVVDVYLPAGYGESPTKQYNLQVMLDGDMHLRQDAFGNSMGTKHILDNLIAEGKVEPVVAVFLAPTTPTLGIAGDWEEMPRLREYGCDLETDGQLANLPRALQSAGIAVTSDPQKTGICGQSMGGLQALYTAKMHPQIYGQVIAQSPAVWWGPSSERLAGDDVERKVRYEDDLTWRAPLSSSDQQQYILKMLQTGMDDLSRKPVPAGAVNVFLQAGTQETGDCGQGDEPLKQATEMLATELKIPCKIHDGGHTAEAWASGLAVALPSMHPKLEVTASIMASSGDPTLTALQPSAEELLVVRERMQSFKTSIPHAAPTPVAGITGDETQEDDNSFTP
jgi:pimeloyl-ACP methyl ester carboxylesterase